MDLCFATNNIHKLEEIKAILGNKYQIVSLEDINCHEELPEERNTLEGNSLQKAEYVFNNYSVSCFADDTGLEVESLDGAPGVYSARYAGEQRSHDDNMNLLLKNLAGKTNRKAQFRTVVTLIQRDGLHQFDGIVEGVILEERKGKGGFGYDPIFLPNGFSKTLAEMSMEEKNRISHRARATQKLVEFLKRNQR
ncbi:MAG: non-canonical purine NTP diphosphatase [Bacteroidia bacterium]|nr:non-canonical purine NTP diphosphatase [Bacteroidia bacterium]